MIDKIERFVENETDVTHRGSGMDSVLDKLHSSIFHDGI